MPTEEPDLLSSLHFQQGEKDMADAWLPRHREINSKEMLPHSEVPWAGVIVYILTGWAEYPTTNLAVMVESPSMGAVLMILTQPIYWPAVVLNIKMKAWWKSPLFSWGSLFGIPCQDDFLFLLQSMGWETEMLCPCCYPNAEGARIFGKKRKRKLCLQKRTALLLSAFVKVGWERGSKWWVVGWFFF